MKIKTEREWNKKYLLKDGDYKSTKEMFERIATLIPDKKLLANLDENKNIVYHTASDILRDVELIGNAFLNLRLKDKHIAIIGDNSYEYLITDMAIVGGLGTVTPIDKDANEELLITLLNRVEANAIVCSTFEIVKLERILDKCPTVETLITIEEKVKDYPYLKDLMASTDLSDNKYRALEIDDDKTCQLLLTSGTTGPNKAVEICQRNMSANIINCIDMVKGTNDDTNTSMSILPMHHATEINTHILPRIACGRLTYINDSMKTMMENIKIFKPYVITIVPMIANMFYKTIWQQAKKAGKDELLKKGIKLCNLLKKFGKDITHKLFKDVFVPFGGNLNQIVCGGAALNPEVVKGLNDLGIFTVNGYGITECGPLVSMNTDTVKETASIGFAAPNLTIKIDNPDDTGVGELCVKGPSIAKGYYKDEKATKEAFMEDGFFHTGDFARVDKKGRIYLSGRKKNTIVLENGKNVYPEEIETEIANTIPYIKESVVYEGIVDFNGKERTVICTGILLDQDNAPSREQIKEDFLKLNQNLLVYKRVAYVDVVDTEYEKTSTRKIIRDLASKRHTKDQGIII